jgi:REP element-mobilizing transposase RayT
MSIKKQVSENNGIYFITFTCYKWMHLINTVNGHDMIYEQLDHLKKQGHFIVGYVIMPNHLHLLIAFKNTGKTINRIIGNVKRFMAYEIVKRLKELNAQPVLAVLAEGVNATDKSPGKLHEVFEPSFDCKECRSKKFIDQKLNYIHANPCAGKWNLAVSPVAYKHSSALFYITGDQGVYEVTNFLALEDIDLVTLAE